MLAILSLVVSAVLFADAKIYQAADQEFYSGDKLWGQRRSGDRLLYESRAKHSFDIIRDIFRYPAQKYGGRVVLDINLPLNQHHFIANITYIEAWDLSWNHKGGNVCIIRGGVGQCTLTLHFQSAYNGIINYFVRVYGYGRPNC